MTFTCKDYVSENETTVLSGTYQDYNTRLKKYEGFCNFLLTNKKIILAGEDILDIVPLNKISRIYIKDCDGIKTLRIYSASDYHKEIVATNNADWLNQILREIAKRIG